MSPIPGFYDYAAPAGWPLPAGHPASPEFHTHCAQWIDQLSWSEVAQKAKQAPEVARKYFDYEVVRPKFTDFVHRLIDLDTIEKQPESAAAVETHTLHSTP